MRQGRIGIGCRVVVVLGAALLVVLGAAGEAPQAGDGTVAGTVEDRDGRPVAGALVAAVPEQDWRPSRTTRADREGRFRLEGLAPGVYGLTATAPGLAAVYQGGVRAEAAQPTSGVRLVLGGEGFTLHGVVRDDEGKPLPNAAVNAVRFSEVQGDVFQVEADEKGAYAITLPRASYVLLAALVGYEPEPEQVAKAEDRSLDLQLLSLARASLPAPPEVVGWIRSHAVPLATCEAGHGFADMAPLKKLVGDARVVALGEATHGTREFFQLKHRMLELLVSEMGFTVFGIEASFPESLAVNEYVLHGTGDPATALAGMYFWTWDTEEVLDLIRWMRSYNEDPEHARKVKFYGFDMQFTQVAVPYVLEYLKKADPEYAAQAATALAPLGGERGAAGYPEMPEEVKNATAAAVADILKRFDGSKDTYVARTGEEAWALARQHAVVVGQAEALYARRGEARDRAMAQNILWLLDHEGPGTKAVVWAHNGHVTVTGGDDACSFMGCHLRQALGKDLLVIGFAFDQGSFQAIDPVPGRGLHDFTVGPAPQGTLNATLAQAGLPLFVLDIRGVPDSGVVGTWWNARHRERSIGALYDEAAAHDFWQRSCLPRTYDALLFVEQTSAARANPSARGRRTPGADVKPAPAPENLDFEKGGTGEVPIGWRLPEASLKVGYQAILTGERPFHGERCAVLSGKGPGFGTLMQRFDAAPYRGKRVRFAAAVRAEVEGADSWVGLWLRVDRQSGGAGFFDNMQDRPITSSDWQTYAIEGEVAADAGSVNLGLMVVGAGRAWVDAVSFVDVEAAAPGAP